MPPDMRHRRTIPLTLIFVVAALVIMLPLSASAALNLPVEGGTVTSGVGWRVDPFGSGKMLYHKGIDIAVPVGTAVRATIAGRVIYAGAHGGYGNTVIVEKKNGDRTLYGHNSAIIAKQGEEIDAGTVIALSGSSGRSTGPHVHYEIQMGRHSVAVAEVKKETEDPARMTARDARDQKEQMLDETMNSLLQKIQNLSIVTGSIGQGGE